jgi:hypothetical protein
MIMLFLGEQLPPEYLDHALTGDWIGFRECHIGGDFLMIYEHTRLDLITFVDLGRSLRTIQVERSRYSAIVGSNDGMKSWQQAENLRSPE